MTDKELLEYAANSTGKTWQLVNYYKYGYEIPGMKHLDEVNDVVYWFPWNPLEDNDSAFSLAVDLGMDLRIITLPHVVYINAATYNTTALEILSSVTSTDQPDKQAATRRAIVNCAAKIELMKGTK